MKSHRLARVAEVVRETVATVILFELKDPRVKGVTVTRAEVAADLQHAKVYVSIMGTEKEQKLAMHGLRAASGFIQTKLAKQLTTRFVPALLFVLDDGVKKSIAIARIIEEEKAKHGLVDESTENPNDSEDDFDADEPAEDDSAGRSSGASPSGPTS